MALCIEAINARTERLSRMDGPASGPASKYNINLELPTMSSLWIGHGLRWYDALGLTSFLYYGHRVKLYCYAPVENVPLGVEICDARTIFDMPQDLLAQTAPSFVADIFRIHLMGKTEEVWVDSDMICLQPVTLPGHGFIAGATGEGDQVNNSILRLSKQSKALKILRSAVSNPDFVAPWLGKMSQKNIRKMPPGERLVGHYQTRRIALGPLALTHCLKVSDEMNMVQPQEVYSPIYWTIADLPFNPRPGIEHWITGYSQTLHLWSSMLRRHHKIALPHPNSFIGQQLTKLNVEFAI